MNKPFTLYKGTPPRKHHYRGYSVGERVIVREGPYAGLRGVIEQLRPDGRPILRMQTGALVNSEDAGQWVRPDVAPPPTQFFDRHLIPLGWGDKGIKAAPSR